MGIRATIGYGLRVYIGSFDITKTDNLCNCHNARVSLIPSGHFENPTSYVLMIDDSIQVIGPEEAENLRPSVNQPNRHPVWFERMKIFCADAGIDFNTEFDLDWYCCVCEA